jgi:hypothetical protein
MSNIACMANLAIYICCKRGNCTTIFLYYKDTRERFFLAFCDVVGVALPLFVIWEYVA